jgi:hypothetical protein
MDWLRRTGRAPTPDATAPGEPPSAAIERTTPGVASLLEGVSADRSHAVLDLGAATDSSLQVYGRFARWVRFADLSATADSTEEWAAAVDALPPQPQRPYDLVFAWDVLDRIPPPERPRLIQRLVEISAPDARLFVVVDSSGSATSPPLRFTLLDTDRMRFEPAGPARPTWPPLLPAEVERLIAPFQVRHAFTSQVGLREYVAVRPTGTQGWGY